MTMTITTLTMAMTVAMAMWSVQPGCVEGWGGVSGVLQVPSHRVQSAREQERDIDVSEDVIGFIRNIVDVNEL